MLIWLMPEEYYLPGALKIIGDIESTRERRTAKRKTLDGGVAIFDGGLVRADEDLRIVTEYWDDETIEHLRSMWVYEYLKVSWADGLYKCAPGNWTLQGKRMSINLLTHSVLSYTPDA